MRARPTKIPHAQEVRRAKRLLRILDAIANGATDAASVAERTGLDTNTVSGDLTALQQKVALQLWRDLGAWPANKRRVRLTSKAPAIRQQLQSLVAEYDDEHWAPAAWRHPYRRSA